RNRSFNPPLTQSEVQPLAAFSAPSSNLPNPSRGPGGAPPAMLALRGGGTGHPRTGMPLFEGQAACVRCPPPPYFTTDQDRATRGKFLDVGTPHLLPLRPQFQEDFFRGVGVPALIGGWDVFPMFTTGLAGFRIKDGRVVGSERVPLRAVIEHHAAPPHGNASALDAQGRADLLAYLLPL